jgi:hypothetical protein
MSNKTISINPSLFSLGGSKTKKNKDKKSKPTAVPLISPSVLKNKLLKRIKEHKQKETQDLENNKRKLSKNEEFPLKQKNEILNYTDEFTDSINYLQTLSKQKQKEELERKTIRNYHSMGEQKLTQGQGPIINIDLPEELAQNVIPISTETFHIKPKDDVPYGVLKGGTKLSYREWSKTQRNNVVTNPNNSLVIQGSNLSSQKTARENRLNLLKQKIKNKAEEKLKDTIVNQNLIKKSLETQSNDSQAIITQPTVLQPTILQPTILQPTVLQVNNSRQIEQQNCEKIIATKYITKKTIKRKYTLGRSKIKKTVSVLIKDKGTRKQILNAQKDLKRKNINDIKPYLREHNLIKTGSNAPNDVLRKIYESAMLSGEITNSNSDVLLHNFSKEDKEL